MKENGAGRPYFVVYSVEGTVLLVSQSFIDHSSCVRGICSLKAVLGQKDNNRKPDSYPTFLADRDPKGFFSLIIFENETQSYLLTGRFMNEKTVGDVLGEISSVVAMDDMDM